ncbi:MAG TPA: F0F1 ATP synthase subunit A [Longimicrobiales bacterium]|nr:F0F1 ATP synthase subunit A [Longimicrobiales bacterium]
MIGNIWALMRSAASVQAEAHDATEPMQGADAVQGVDAVDATHGAEAGGHGAGEFDIGETMMHHLTDSREWEAPWGVVHLPQFDPVHLGPLVIDFSITKHVLFMLFAAALVLLVMIPAARQAKRARAAGAGAGPSGATNVVEAFVLFIRDEIALKNIGHGGERYVPFIVTLFFFILFANLIGLLPWGATATGNIAVTAALAMMTLIVVEVAGMRTLGPKGYLSTIFYAPPGMGPVGKALMLVIMTPVEFLSKLTKPFALAIRLFANMNAGHFIILALIGLIMLAMGTVATLIVIPAPVVMAVAIGALEIFVSFLQAYIFAMLSSVFIGLIVHAH